MTKTILVIAAHPDDEVLGCSGTMARHISDGDKVHVVFMSDGVTSRTGQESKEIELRKQAAKDAVIAENIEQFPLQYETLVGERGVTLSGGQKQRISIARALLKSPKILVFDDCLSAVDLATEERILKNLKRLMINKTTVLISHRVSTIKHADNIIVLDGGKIVESGTHETLLKTDGIYADLNSKQQLEVAE